MEENWKGAAARPIPNIENEGGMEAGIISFHIYCAVRRSFPDKPSYDSEVIKLFRDYLYNHWDHATSSFGTHASQQEGLILIPSLRHTALGAYGLLLLNQIQRHVHEDGINAVLTSLFDRKRNEYRDKRSTGLAYLIMDYIGQALVDDDAPSPFDAYDATPEVLDLIRKWRKSYAPAMAKAFMKDRYSAIPRRGKRATESNYPFIIPYGCLYRMSTYSHLTACMFVTEKSQPAVRERMAAGVQALCKAYNTRRRAKRYKDGDPLKPTVRGVKPWPDEKKLVDIGATAQLLSLLTNPMKRRALWRDTEPPGCVEAIAPLLHEDLIEQFDRFLIEPGLFRHTPAATLAHVLLVPDGNNEAGLDEIEDAVEKYRGEHGLSEWSLNRMVEDVIFRERDELPTHIFARSLGRLLLDRTRPGLYPVGPLAFNGDPSKADSLIEKTSDKYRDKAFAQKFDMVHGSSPNVGLTEMFIETLGDRGGKTVLDVGCGPGQYAELFQNAGLDVELLDVSPAMLSLAGQRLGWKDGDPRAVVGDVREIERVFRGRKFDGIWCCSTLVHFPEPVAEQILRSFARLLTKDGVLMANTAIGNPRLIAEDERFYAYWHDPGDFTRLLDACGFDVVRSLSTQVSRNVHWEPRLAIRWDSFFCRLPSTDTDDEEAILARSRDMTSTAYGLIVRRFYAEHGATPSTDVVDQFLDQLPPGSRILDAGCGPGHYSASFWEKGYVGVGLDLCPEMISHARHQHKDLRRKPDRRFEVGDMCGLDDDFKDSSFDGVFCMAAFQHVPAAKGFSLATLQGFARVLRPGGILLLDVQLGRAQGFEPDGRFTERYDSVEEAEALVIKAGFEVVKSGPATVLKKGKNAFKRAVELHFCNILARKPGRLERPVSGQGATETDWASTCRIHFDGQEKGPNTLVKIDGKELWLAPGYFVNLLRIARGSLSSSEPVHTEELVGASPQLQLNRLRQKLSPYIDCDPTKFIELDGAGFPRLSVSHAHISFDDARLASHSSQGVRDEHKALAASGIALNPA